MILVIFKNLTILLDLVVFVMLLNLVILKKKRNFVNKGSSINYVITGLGGVRPNDYNIT